MATVVLQAVGTAIGGAVGGPIGAAIGGAIGGAVGYSIDQTIFSKDQVVAGPRLDQARFLASTTGAPVPRVYGRARLGGQIIWATRFEEVRSTTERGGKGGGPSTKVTEFSYFANFAVGICEGEITAIRRIWADGEELDLTTLDYRVYRGGESEEPDPLMEAKQGIGNVPSYLGTAYVVFEGFPLTAYGNRLPQISFEVIRSVNTLDRSIEAVSIIPGAGEYAYEPAELSFSARGQLLSTNRNNLMAASDWKASIDELQALCPNLKRVSLIVSWFGTDLRASHCRFEPRINPVTANNAKWNVVGLNRATANPVSLVGNGDEARPAFGGTPTDQSVVNAIIDLKQRGLEVVLYPFVMMDIPPENTLPNPYATSSGSPYQKPYPWRGEITCDHAIGEPDSDDQTSHLDQQVAALCGTASPSDFSISQGRVAFSGSDEWSYRRHILHYAKIAELAGGVSGFVIGSELRSLTRLRNDQGDFPFVTRLTEIAQDARSMLGSQCKLTYAADWSEYSGYQPQDGSGDLWFNLDELWASPAIDVIGIDNYMPLSDWRENGDPDQPGTGSPYDLERLGSAIAAGEGFDWYYASESDREAGERILITDGYGEPWVWRYKDLVSWWSKPHYNRPGGLPVATPTPFVPMAKPIWFTELGCPAVDKGANQPNVFPDSKTGENLPYFSSGRRDDLIQNRFLLAHLGRWNSDGPDNPASPLYSGTMVDPGSIYLWAWDARPFPLFPREVGIWADGDNHETGHWLNGRIGACGLEDLLSAILDDYGFSDCDIKADGFLDGYVIASNVSARAALEPLIATHRLAASNAHGVLSIRSPEYASIVDIDPDMLAEGTDGSALPVLKRSEETELPYEMAISHAELYSGYEQTRTSSRQLSTDQIRMQSVDLPAVMSSGKAAQLADAMLHQRWVGRERISFSLGTSGASLEPGDLFRFVTDDGVPHHNLDDVPLWQVDAIEHGLSHAIDAHRIELLQTQGDHNLNPQPRRGGSVTTTSPLVHVLDLPAPDQEAKRHLHFAVAAKPWARDYSILSSPEQNGFRLRGQALEPAWIGTLTKPLTRGVFGRWDHSATIEIDLPSAVLSSATQLQVLGGRNIVAIHTGGEAWELIQYQKAELIGPDRWKLSCLLRGQAGSDPEMPDEHLEGTQCVIVNQALHPVEMDRSEKGLRMNWSVGPSRLPIGSNKRTAFEAGYQDMASRPLRPCHLRIVQTASNLTVNWIRRTRLNGDSWEDPEVPLGEEQERYRVTLYASNGQVLADRNEHAAGTVFDLTSLSSVPGEGEAMHVEVRQVGTGQRTGPPAIGTCLLSAIS